MRLLLPFFLLAHCKTYPNGQRRGFLRHKDCTREREENEQACLRKLVDGVSRTLNCCSSLAAGEEDSKQLRRTGHFCTTTKRDCARVLLSGHCNGSFHHYIVVVSAASAQQVSIQSFAIAHTCCLQLRSNLDKAKRRHTGTHLAILGRLTESDVSEGLETSKKWKTDQQRDR